MSYYTLDAEIDKEWTPKIDAFIKSIENGENPGALDLTMQPGLNPSRVREIITDRLGYIEEDFDHNGWDWDYWFIFMHKSRPTIMLRGTGMTSEIYLEKG